MRRSKKLSALYLIKQEPASNVGPHGYPLHSEGEKPMIRLSTASAALVFAIFSSHPGLSQTAAPSPNYESWALLTNPFESTSGGGVMIDGYKPVVVEKDGQKICMTDFTVQEPKGPILQSAIIFETKAVQGGILCTNGKWRMKDGSAEGTTPFEVFIKDGVMRRSP
jgi:hypothetical protein